MSEKSNVVAEVEQKVVSECRFISTAIDLLDCIGSRCIRVVRGEEQREKWRKGMSMLREALVMEHFRRITHLYAISGVGGEEAARYAKEECRRLFGDSQKVTRLLVELGIDIDGFLDDVAEKLEKTDAAS